MSERHPGSEERIPVFSIRHRGSVQRGAHPDYKGPVPSDSDEEILSRVGSAWTTQDGNYLIQLVAFPVNGQLLLRLAEERRPSAPGKE